MSNVLKWAGNSSEKIQTDVSKLESKPETIIQLESENEKLKTDFKKLKSLASSQLKEIQDKHQAASEILKSTTYSLESSLAHLVEENRLLKEHLKNSEIQLGKMSAVNEELSLSIEKDEKNEVVSNSVEEYQHQINFLNEKSKRQTVLLKAENLKKIDAEREKQEIIEFRLLESKTFESQIKVLKELIEKEKQNNFDYCEQIESKVQGLDGHEQQEVEENLENKQRTIDKLISDKEKLLELIQTEV